MKKSLIFLILVSIATAFVVLRSFGQSEILTLRSQIAQAGMWAPIIYMVIYTLATALVLPSTVLNLMGGALFGTFWGLIWTTLAALISAIATFWVARKWIRGLVHEKLDYKWANLDREIREGGIFYLLAIRFFPIIPYGIVNYSAGLTSVRFRHYLLGTSLGTAPGLLPFVMLGDSGIEAMTTGQMWRVLIPLTLISLLIATTTWYKRHHKSKI